MQKFNINLVLNVVVLVGLAVLYILYFTDKNLEPKVFANKAEKEKIEVDTIVKTANPISTAFVNTDTILEHYALVKELKAQLESKKARLESDFLKKQKAFEKEATIFQEKLQRGSFISKESAAYQQEDLVKKEQNLYQLKETYTNDLMEEEMDMHERIQDSLFNFIKRYNNNKFDYVLGYAQGSGILFATEKYDLTNEVLAGLNKAYKQKKTAK